MAVYTNLSHEDLLEVAAIFNLPEITSVLDFPGGQENSNYHIKSGGKDYVLSLCENKTAAEVKTLVDTLAHLRENDFRTTRIFPTVDGHQYAWLYGKPLLLKSYLPGEVSSPLPLEKMVPLGKEMARLHQVPTPDFLPDTLAYGRQTFAPLRQKFGRPHPFTDWLEMIDNYLRDNLPTDLPRALIHADIFADNVIISPLGRPVIMDFEEATNYYRVFDLGMAIVGTCYPEEQLNAQAREHLLQGYAALNPLTTAEVKSLRAATVYAAAGMASWRFWQFNVVQPEAGKREHYRALQKIAEDLLTKAS